MLNDEQKCIKGMQLPSGEDGEMSIDKQNQLKHIDEGRCGKWWELI